MAVALSTGIVSGLFLPHFLVTLYEILAGFSYPGGGRGHSHLASLHRPLAADGGIILPYIIAFQAMPRSPFAADHGDLGSGLRVWTSQDHHHRDNSPSSRFWSNTIVGLRFCAEGPESTSVARSAPRRTGRSSAWSGCPRPCRSSSWASTSPWCSRSFGAIVGEFVGAKAGLGYLILQMNFNFNIAGVFAILIILSKHWHRASPARGRDPARVLFWSEAHSGTFGGA